MSNPSGYRSPFPLSSGLGQPPSTPQSVSIVIPFFNEEECVEFVLREIVENQPGAEIVAVDDGSTDSTWDLMQEIPGITPLRLTENRGQSGSPLRRSPLCIGRYLRDARRGWSKRSGRY